MRVAVVVCGLVLGVTAAHADEIRLKDGQVIRGFVSKVGDQVVVQMDIGTISFPRDQVADIKVTPTALTELKKRRRALTATDVNGLAKLAAWAASKRLVSHSRALYREVLAVSPNHAAARAALGYQRVGNDWLTHDQAMHRRGYVKRGGRWVTLAEVEAEKTRKAQKKATEDKAASEARIYELERQVALARYEAERARRKAEGQPLDPGLAGLGIPFRVPSPLVVPIIPLTSSRPRVTPGFRRGTRAGGSVSRGMLLPAR